LLSLLAIPCSATILDLTTQGASGSIGAAFFIQESQGAGTGIFDSFMRIHANGTEKGVNSDGPYTMDEKAGIWTRSVLVSQFGVTDLNGVTSIRFMLDINQVAARPLLSLDQIKIFVSPVGTYHTLEQLTANAEPIYDLGAGNSIHLNYGLDAGSGESDMVAYLPYSLFAAHAAEYLYLFSELGATGGQYASNDGFEEWGSAGDPPPTGACCDHATGDCAITAQAACGFEWLGAGVPCDVETCQPPPPPITGACCDQATGDCVVTTQAGCPFDWLGAGVSCDAETCPPPQPPEGACCNHATGDCSITTQVSCAFDWLGASMSCDVQICSPPPSGACCDHTTSSCSITSQGSCLSDWLGADVPCNLTTCRLPLPTERSSWGQIKNSYR
jgi:hypothetical protein